MLKNYRTQVLPALRKDLGYGNDLAVPRIEKVVLNVGVGADSKDSDLLETVERTLSTITGQKPVRTKARISISNFKIREGMVVGAKVTLRGPRMYDFLERLVHFTLPRMRDFRGLDPESFDGHGNYSIGIKEHIVFPEMKAEDIGRLHGLEIAILTSAQDDDEGEALLRALGFPLRKKESGKKKK